MPTATFALSRLVERQYRGAVVIDVRFDESLQTDRCLIVMNGKLGYVCYRRSDQHMWRESLSELKRLKCQIIE
jgi:hypothetical protein